MATKQMELAELKGEEVGPIEGGADQSGTAGGDGVSDDTTGTSSTSRVDWSQVPGGTTEALPDMDTGGRLPQDAPGGSGNLR